MYTHKRSREVMEEIKTSSLLLPMPSSSKSVLREEALAAWRFKPFDKTKDQDADVAWIFEASQRDMEIVTRALVTELNSTPDKGVTVASNEKNAGPSTSEVASSSISSCDPGSPSQASDEAETSAGMEDSDSKAGQSEAPETRIPHAEALSRTCNNHRSIRAMKNFSRKKRSRKRNRAPITIMTADPTDFRSMVQQMTGFPVENSSKAAPSLWKPQRKRPSQMGSNMIPSASSSVGLQ